MVGHKQQEFRRVLAPLEEMAARVVEHAVEAEGNLTFIIRQEQAQGAVLGKVLMFFMEFARLQSVPIMVGLSQSKSGGEDEAARSVTEFVTQSRSLSERAQGGEMIATTVSVETSDAAGLFCPFDGGAGETVPLMLWRFGAPQS